MNVRPVIKESLFKIIFDDGKTFSEAASTLSLKKATARFIISKKKMIISEENLSIATTPQRKEIDLC